MVSTMQDVWKKDFGMDSAHSTSPYVGCTSWGNSSESELQQSSLSQSLSLKMGAPPRNYYNSKQINFQFQDQDSSSSQSTGQSYPEVGDSQSILSAQSGHNDTDQKAVGGHSKLGSSMGAQDFLYAPSQARVPFHFAEPYFGGLLTAAYSPEAVIHHPQMLGMTPSRVPLPLDLTQDEPIYVNAKQYHGILRRRQYRAKLVAQNKLVKARKPYLHESRHLHALKRARGSGGRFLNAKKLQESKSSPTSDGYANSKTSTSGVTSASNGDNTFRHPEYRFSSYPSRIGGPTQGQSGGGGAHVGANHLHLPHLR